MTKLFYQGDNTAKVSFRCEAHGRRINPSWALVSIHSDGKDAIVEGTRAEITENEVSYRLPLEVTNTPDEYVAIFELMFPIEGQRRHIIMFTIAPREISRKSKGTSIEKLTVDSNPHDVDRAITDTLRNLRRTFNQDAAIKQVYLDAQAKTGRRIER